MGLDQYAYAAARAGQYNEFWRDVERDSDGDLVNSLVSKPREIAYWRKHPNLQGWMQRLAESKRMKYDTFNGVELELTWEDLDRLESDIRDGSMAKLGTRGFFYGDFSDDHYREQDLKFIREARAELFSGLRVFYNSSW